MVVHELASVPVIFTLAFATAHTQNSHANIFFRDFVSSEGQMSFAGAIE